MRTTSALPGCIHWCRFLHELILWKAGRILWGESSHAVASVCSAARCANKGDMGVRHTAGMQLNATFSAFPPSHIITFHLFCIIHLCKILFLMAGVCSHSQVLQVKDVGWCTIARVTKAREIYAEWDIECAFISKMYATRANHSIIYCIIITSTLKLVPPQLWFSWFHWVSPCKAHSHPDRNCALALTLARTYKAEALVENFILK